MSWLSDSNANRFKKSYIQGFLDVSGGNLIVESSSTIQVMSSEFSGQAALLIKPDRFSVFTGQSSYDISYETFAALGFLGVSYQYTTTDIYNRIQFIGSSTLTGNKTFVGSDSSLSDLVVYGNISTVNNGNITGAKNFLLTGDASLNSKLYVAGNARIDSSLLVNTDLSVNQNMFVTGRSQFNNDVSMNCNVDIGTGNNSVAINKDISANVALDVSGTTVLRGPLSITRDLSLNQSLQIGSDLSVNRFLYVGNNALFNTDLSVNQNLYVTGRALFGRPPPNGTAFEVDLSGQMRIYETVGTQATATTGSLVLKHADASGASSIVFQSTNDAGSDYAYIQYQENVGGASQKGLLTIGVENESGSGTTADRISLYAAGGSGFVGVNTKTPVYNLDISGTAGVTGAFITNVINPTNTGSDMTFGAAQLAGNLEIGNNASRSGYISIGTGNTSKTITVGAASTGTTTLQGGTITINPASILELGNNDADVAITMGRDQTTGTIDIGNKVDRTAAINIGTGSSAKTMSIGGTNTTLQMYGVDASFAGNVKLGSGSKSVAINKDISSNFALDVSGATMLRGVLSTVADVSINGRIFASGDVSLNQKLFVNQDTSLNGNLSVNGRAIFNADVSLNNNTRLGIGNNSVAINKDISSNFSLDVSGTTVLRGVTITLSDVSINSRLFVQSDVSLNQKLFVNSDVSINSNLSVGQVLTVNNRALFSSDVSLNRNVDIGAGNNSVAINKDISSNFALDVSGATMLRGALSTLSDVSINGKLSVGGDISLNGNITIGNIQTIGVGLKQPPAAMTANVTNIPGHGSYYAYTSSLQPDSLNPFVVFDNGNLSYNTPSFYTTAVGDPSINVWSGTDTISDVAAVAYPGYRFHIDLPYQINLSSFSYTAGPGRYPVQGTMLGSNNGTSWYNIISFDLSASLNNSTTQSTILTFPYDVSSNTSFYSKYALVTRSIGCPTLPGTRVTLREIQLYGNNNILSTKGIGTTSLGVSENLTVGSTANLYGNVTIGNIENVYNRVGAAKLLIMEPSGTVATATSGSLVLQHGDASGVSSIVFRSANDQGSDYAYIQYQENVGGASQKGLLTIGVENESGSGATADRMSLYAAGGSGFVGVNTLDPQYHLDVSGNLRVSGNMITSLDVSLNRNTRLGTGSNSVAVNKDISSNFALDVSGATMLRGVLSTLSDISINGRLFASSDVSLNQKLFVQQDASLNSNLSIGQALTVNSRALFISDVSLNANTRLGAGRNSIAVNKDISSNFALDVSGITNLRAPLYTLSDVSINGKLFATGDASFNTSLFVGQDLSVNRFLYVNNATLFNGDISSNQNLYVAGKATFGRPPSNTTYELDVSGQVRIYEPSGSNVNSASSVATLTLEHGDASGCSSIMFKSPSTVSNNDYAYIKYQDLSGATTNAGLLTLGIENDATGVNAGKISLFSGNGSGYVGINTLTPAFNLDISGNANVSSSLITNAIDPSNVASTLNIAATQTSGILNIATEATRTGAINIGTGTSNGHNVTIGGTANGSTTTLQGRDTVVIPDPVGQLFLGNNVTTGNVFLGNAMTGGNLFIGPVGGSSSTTVINFATAAGTRTMSVGGSGTTLNVYAPDVSFSGNVRLGQSNTTNRVSINKDISSNFALDVSGATNLRGVLSTLSDISINGRLFTSGDVSFNQNLAVSQDVSVNRNLDISGTLRTRKIEPFDLSLNGAIVIGSTLQGPSGSIKIGTTGATTYVDIGNTTIFGGNLRFNEAGFIIGNTNALAMNFATTTTTGNITIGNALTSGNLILSGVNHTGKISIGDANRNGNIVIGGHHLSSLTYVNAGSVRVKDQGAGTFYVGRIPEDVTGDAIAVAIVGGVNTTGNVDILNGSGSTGNVNIGRGPAIKIANGATTNIDISASGTLALTGTTVTAPTTALDNSSNQIATTAFVKNNISNLVGGAGPALDTLYELATAINNDASFSFNIISAINLRSYDASVVHLTGTESIAGNKTFTNDTVIGQNLTVNKNLTTVQKGWFGYGTAQIGTPYEFDISGQMRIYELVGSDVNSNASVATLTLEHGDASGSSSIMFKSPSTVTNGDYAYIKYQDLSGGTTNTGLLTIGVENDPTAAATADKISLYAAGGLGYVGINTLNPAFNLDISGNTRIGTGNSISAINKDPVAGYALDISGNARVVGSFMVSNTFIAVTTSASANIFGSTAANITFGGVIPTANTITIANSTSTGKVNINGNIKLGPGTKYVTVNKDLSTNFIFDVSGDSMFRDKLFVTQDASFGSNVIVVGDTSLNGNLIVGKRSLFNQDVSMTQNLDIGSGNSSVAINKDISSNFALDVSGLTNVRGDLSIVGGTITVNGLPVSGGGAGTSLTTQGVKVGTDANYFVTIDKTNFYNDPSLVMYYTFDTSINGGIGVQNIANPGVYDLSLSTNGGATTGMIDTVKYRVGRASLKNDSGPSFNNLGVNTINPQISNTMSFSFWINKTTAINGVVGTDFDRIFEFTNNTLFGQTNEKYTIALDVSASGLIIPTVTKGLIGTTSIISSTAQIRNYTIADSSWNHVTWVINNLNSYLYLNGSIVSQNTFSEQLYRIAPSTLLLWYQMENNANNSGQLTSMDGTLVGPPTFSSSVFQKGAYSLQSTGASQYITVPSFTWPTTGITISAWFYRSSPGSLDLFTFGSGANSFSINMFGASFPYNIYVVVGVAQPIFYSSSTANGVWAHLAVTLTSGSVSKLYINGSQVGSGATGLYPSGTISTNKIGQHAGYTDDFRLYNTVLSDAEILTIYNETNVIDSYSRNLMIIAGSTRQNRDFSGNIDEFRYYNDKALNQAEIYQLSNNRFFNLDICGGFLANGSSVIYEPLGLKAGPNSGTLTLLHGDASGSSSIMFKSVNDPLEYGYIQYEENATGSTGYHFGLLTIGIENDGGIGAYTDQADRVSLFPSGGTGFVGVNTKQPRSSLDVSGTMNLNGVFSSSSDISLNGRLFTNGDVSLNQKLFVNGVVNAASDISLNGRLFTNGDVSLNQKLFVNGRTLFNSDVSFNQNVKLGTGSNSVSINKDISSNFALDLSGQMRIYENAGTVASTTAGSLVLEHAASGGTSSIMFKGPTGPTFDYAYVQYTDAFSAVQSLLKYDLSAGGTAGNPTGNVTFTSTGTSSLGLSTAPTDNSFAWVAGTLINNITPAVCISFNQTNLTSADTTSRINYLQTGGLPNMSSFTFSAWIRPGQIAGSGVNWMIANLTNSTADGVVDIYLNNSGTIFALVNDGTANYITTTNPPLALNTWYHLVFTFDGINRNGYLYLNGALRTNYVNGIGLSGLNLKPNNNLLVGMKYGWNTGNGSNSMYGPTSQFKGFRGQMAFINVFDRAVTANDVDYLYNNPAYNVATNPERGLLTIGIENDTGAINNDRIVLWPGAGTGFVGINTRTPSTALDINGSLNVSNTITNNNGQVTMSGNSGTILKLQNRSSIYNSGEAKIDFFGADSFYQLGAVGCNDRSVGPAGVYVSSMSFYINYDVSYNLEGMRITGSGKTSETNRVNAKVYGNVEATSYNAVSDYREKINVSQLNASFTVDVLNPVIYNLKDSGKQDVGFIAHEVQEFYPFLVTGQKDGETRQSLNYNGFIGILTKEIKDLKKKVSEQEKQISDQDERLQALEKLLLNK